MEAARNICAVYGDNVIGESTAIKWFSHFKEDRFDISDTPRSGRPSGFDEDRIVQYFNTHLRNLFLCIQHCRLYRRSAAVQPGGKF